MDAKTVLEKTPFFADILIDDDIAALAAAAKRHDYDKDSIIVREHDSGESLFIVVHGAVTVSTRDSGAARRVTTLHDGAIVGEMSLLTGAARAATVTALRPTVTLEIDKAGLAPILARSPDLADRFATMVDARKEELEDLHGTHWFPSAGALAARIRSFFAG
ncbi:cyclic nucleotide-binding domain-containing protein [Bauldia sp.]|uniref:cyclic nucleotide-binding domain-containing protein n=1 Tax=Bauldia sp. TaxID=2575872 RepID=UPI003BAA5C11